MRLILCALVLTGVAFLPAASADPPDPSLECAGVFEPVDDPDGSLQAALDDYLAGGPEAGSCPGPDDVGTVPTGTEPGGTVVEPPATDPTAPRDVTLRIAVQLNGRAIDTGATGVMVGTGDQWFTVRDQASQPWWEFRLRGVTADAFQFDMTATHYVQLIGRVYAEFQGTASIAIPNGGNYGPAATPPDVTINLQFTGFQILRPPGP
jgi:hypothetical protein